MPLREDFDKKLMKYGRLPTPSLRDHFTMMQKVETQESKIKELQQYLEESKQINNGLTEELSEVQ